MKPSDHQLSKLSDCRRVVAGITGDEPSPATMYRWAQRGLAGVRLRTAFAGGHRRSCEAWIREFFADVTAAKNGTVSQPPRTETPKADRVATAQRELADAGI